MIDNMEMEEFLNSIERGTLNSIVDNQNEYTEVYPNTTVNNDFEILEVGYDVTTSSTTAQPVVGNGVITTTLGEEVINNLNDIIADTSSIIERNLINTEESDDSRDIVDEDVGENTEEEVTTSNNLIEPPIDYVLNTKTILDQSRLRFSSAPWMEYVRDQDITCGGAGGIMSWVVVLLSRLNPATIRVFDPDIFSEVNMAGQFVTTSYIGSSKVTVLHKLCFDFSQYYIKTVPKKLDSNSNLSKIVITGFDSMLSRKEVFKKWKRDVDIIKTIPFTERTTNLKDFLYIDGRLATESFQIFCFTGDDEEYIKLYEDKYLFDDSQADVVNCSYKQTSHIAAMIASFIVSTFVTYCRNRSLDMNLSIIPFLREYDAVFNIDNQII